MKDNREEKRTYDSINLDKRLRNTETEEVPLYRSYGVKKNI